MALTPRAEGNCPNAYAYAFDESSGTALWTCDSGLNADYTLTFCPVNSPLVPRRSTNAVINPSASGSSTPSGASGSGATVSPSDAARPGNDATRQTLALPWLCAVGVIILGLVAF
ncbi:uncharacterized protein BXZ73DRAFT_73951 [Epithele typhae]|uniref:uncharacterized protein n=1 Tax=Epithele typhae TaxID=378194 RepID=UPI00200767E0|nr:uncharacterized protein BXZ73DRAFT_73951 [Epithele typhae]KAH9944437.1 hypothetical protein BXZ73DRAFT_73951 [Epithele typhae]